MITGQQMASTCVQLAVPAVTYCLLPRHATSCWSLQDKRLNFEEWGAAKASLGAPFGQLPVLELDGKLVAQSAAIGELIQYCRACVESWWHPKTLWPLGPIRHGRCQPPLLRARSLFRNILYSSIPGTCLCHKDALASSPSKHDSTNVRANHLFSFTSLE